MLHFYRYDGSVQKLVGPFLRHGDHCIYFHLFFVFVVVVVVAVVVVVVVVVVCFHSSKTGRFDFACYLAGNRVQTKFCKKTRRYFWDHLLTFGVVGVVAL